jgi:hypothetical protein
MGIKSMFAALTSAVEVTVVEGSNALVGVVKTVGLGADYVRAEVSNEVRDQTLTQIPSYAKQRSELQALGFSSFSEARKSLLGD